MRARGYIWTTENRIKMQFERNHTLDDVQWNLRVRRRAWEMAFSSLLFESYCTCSSLRFIHSSKLPIPFAFNCIGRETLCTHNRHNKHVWICSILRLPCVASVHILLLLLLCVCVSVCLMRLRWRNSDIIIAHAACAANAEKKHSNAIFHHRN